jgi:ankyrin repeat protein
MQTLELLVKSSVPSLINAQDKSQGMTPLFVALEHKRSAEVISYLISCGADVNTANTLGTTPLMLADNVTVLRLLLTAGAVVNARCLLGSTVLHRAAEVGASAAHVCCLLTAGADATATDTVGNTAGQVAAECGHTATAALLQRAEADQRSKLQQQQQQQQQKQKQKQKQKQQLRCQMT